MHGDGECTPLLRGRAAGGERDGGAGGAIQQPAPEYRPALLPRARPRPLLLAAAAAAGAAVLMVVIGLMSTSGQAASPQAVSPHGGGANLAATPRQHVGRPAAGETGEGSGARSGGSKESGGGWRSQPSRSQGMSAAGYILFPGALPLLM